MVRQRKAEKQILYQITSLPASIHNKSPGGNRMGLASAIQFLYYNFQEKSLPISKIHSYLLFDGHNSLFLGGCG